MAGHCSLLQYSERACGLQQVLCSVDTDSDKVFMQNAKAFSITRCLPPLMPSQSDFVIILDITRASYVKLYEFESNIPKIATPNSRPKSGCRDGGLAERKIPRQPPSASQWPQSLRLPYAPAWFFMALSTGLDWTMAKILKIISGKKRFYRCQAKNIVDNPGVFESFKIINFCMALSTTKLHSGTNALRCLKVPKNRSINQFLKWPNVAKLLLGSLEYKVKLCLDRTT